MQGMADSGPEHVVNHAEIVEPETLSRLDPDTVVILPASLFGSLSATQRHRLLGAIPVKRVDAFAVPWQSAGRVVHSLAHARRLGARLGLSAGEPGDVAARDAGGERYVLHTFTAEELARELRDAGLEGVEVTTASTDSGPMLHAWGAPRRKANPG